MAIETRNPFTATIPSTVVDQLVHGECALVVDSGRNELKISKLYSQDDADKTIDLFLRALERMDECPTELSSKRKFEIVTAASLYLKNLVQRYHGSLDKGLEKCKHNVFLMKIAKLDRYVLAANLRETFTPYASLSGRKIEQQYKTQVAKDLFQKWLSEPTHAARKHDLSTRVVMPALAEDAFFFRPQDVDFVMENYLHRQVGRQNEQILVNPVTKHVMIKYEGRYESLDRIRQSLISENGKLYSKEGHKRYFYCYDKGLTQFDPVEWKELPVFKKRSHHAGPDDYCVVIKTVDGNEKHSWIELKDPRNKYNVGFFWLEGEETEYWNLCQSVKGMLHVGDKHEYMAEEKGTVKTKFKLTKEQFELLKGEIERFQADPSQKVFNLVNGNCTSWLRTLMQKVGIQVSSKGTISEVFMGAKFGSDFMWRNIPPLRWLKIAGNTILSILRNLLMYLLGGGSNRDVGMFCKRENPNDRAFPTFLDVFKPSQGMFDHPKKLREWQAKVKEAREKMIAEEQEKLKLKPVYTYLTPAQRQQLLESKARELKDAWPQMHPPVVDLAEGSGF
jgi:hypothetical protein